MRKFLISLIINAVAIWLTSELVSGVDIVGTSDEVVPLIFTLLFIALVFSIVNTILGTLLKILTFPLYVLTLGLFSIIVNAIVLSATAWATGLFGIGLSIDKFWWTGIIAAIVLSLINWAINLILKPVR